MYGAQARATVCGPHLETDKRRLRVDKDLHLQANPRELESRIFDQRLETLNAPRTFTSQK